VEIREKLPFLFWARLQDLFQKFNVTGPSLLITFRPHGKGQELSAYLKECMTALTNYLFDDVRDRDLVRLRIRNTENVQDKLVGVSFRRGDQLSVIWYGVWLAKSFKAMRSSA